MNDTSESSGAALAFTKQDLESKLPVRVREPAWRGQLLRKKFGGYSDSALRNLAGRMTNSPVVPTDVVVARNAYGPDPPTPNMRGS